jgi:hypothetical protein
MGAIASWSDVKPGDVLTVQPSYRKRAFRLVVNEIEILSSGKNAIIRGERQRMNGQRSTRRTSAGCGPSALHVIHIDDVTSRSRRIQEAGQS